MRAFRANFENAAPDCNDSVYVLQFARTVVRDWCHMIGTFLRIFLCGTLLNSFGTILSQNIAETKPRLGMCFLFNQSCSWSGVFLAIALPALEAPQTACFALRAQWTVVYLRMCHLIEVLSARSITLFRSIVPLETNVIEVVRVGKWMFYAQSRSSKCDCNDENEHQDTQDQAGGLTRAFSFLTKV